jgi:hypothetical protein
MNRCFHERYVSIAAEYHCDSYWMDTPCIPEAHDLRGEAIAMINSLFSQSKITVVCDRDLLETDVQELPLAKKESILATVSTLSFPFPGIS